MICCYCQRQANNKKITNEKVLKYFSSVKNDCSRYYFSVYCFLFLKRLKETRATSKTKDDLVRGSWQVNVAFTILFSSSFLELILVNDEPEMDYFQGSNFSLKYLLRSLKESSLKENEFLFHFVLK